MWEYFRRRFRPLDIEDPMFGKLVRARTRDLLGGARGPCGARCADRWDVLTDTWHATTEEAKKQANYEFEVLEWSHPTE